MIEQTQGGTGYWVGQGAPKPLTAMGFSPVTLAFTKVANIAVITEELARFSTPSAEGLVRDALRDALIETIDRSLVDPTEAGTANVQPASLTNGLTALSSAGTSADNVRTDLGKLVRALRTANLRGPIAIVMPDSLVTALAFMQNALGQDEFPGLTAEGGTIKGLKIIGSEYVANSSGAGNMVIAIAEREVFLADDGQVVIDASREATLQMLDNPTNNSGTATPTTGVSMWQTNSIALRAERFINWSKRRAEAVAYMDDVNWGSVGSPA
jgi:HK97 family phage major capsid protein